MCSAFSTAVMLTSATVRSISTWNATTGITITASCPGVGSTTSLRDARPRRTGRQAMPGRFRALEKGVARTHHALAFAVERRVPRLAHGVLGHEHQISRRTFDIHGGGMDLMFPHHECELAQNTAAEARCRKILGAQQHDYDQRAEDGQVAGQLHHPLNSSLRGTTPCWRRPIRP